MANKPFLSVIIPAYNEAERIPATLLDIDRRLAAKDWSYEILVMNDGSRDNTAEVVQKLSGAVKNLKLVDNKVNQHKGGVVRQGMLIAQGQYRLFMDADNATSVDHFEKMLPYFEQGYGVVICSRSHKDSRLDPPQPWYRQIAGKVGNLIIQVLVLPGIWDTQCGFKAFTAEAAEKIFKVARITGWGFDVEVLALAKKFGFRIKEVPVHWVNDLSSTVRASAYITTLLETLKIRWWLWTGVYSSRTESSLPPANL